MDMQSKLLLLEDHTERSLARSRQQANRFERAYWRVHGIMVRIDGPQDFPAVVPMDVWRARLDAYARVRDRAASLWGDLETLRRIESDWASDLAHVRADLARIDELHAD
jgi:hypothetical protein